MTSQHFNVIINILSEDETIISRGSQLVTVVPNKRINLPFWTEHALRAQQAHNIP